LLRRAARAGRPGAARVDTDVVPGGRGEPLRGCAQRFRRAVVLARDRVGPARRAGAAGAVAAGPAGIAGFGRVRTGRRPVPRGDRAAVPAAAHRQRVAARRRTPGRGTRYGPGHRAFFHARAVPVAVAFGCTRTHVAGGLTYSQ